MLLGDPRATGDWFSCFFFFFLKKNRSNILPYMNILCCLVGQQCQVLGERSTVAVEKILQSFKNPSNEMRCAAFFQHIAHIAYEAATSPTSWVSLFALVMAIILQQPYHY